jgi:hypothetical protein
MEFRGKLCRSAFCLILAFGSLAGAPMRPEEIEEVMRRMTAPKVTHTLADDAEDGDVRTNDPGRTGTRTRGSGLPEPAVFKA